MKPSTKTFEAFVDFVREWYDTEEFIPLHAPVFTGNEKKYLNECIDSTFVSSVGKFVDEAEKTMAEKLGGGYAVAVVNGTSALHLALHIAGVKQGEEVITQPFTFVATCNAIRYCGADPVFVDISPKTLGLSADSLRDFLENHSEKKSDGLYNKRTGKRLAAVVPMHTFGHPVELDEILEICNEFNIKLVEDSAEAVGSFYRNEPVGRHGLLSVFSFNGNKTITCGGGGMIFSKDEKLAKRAKHLSTVAKRPHSYEFFHEELAFNYRMPNLNAALLLAQLENLDSYLENKRKTAQKYKDFAAEHDGLQFFEESEHCKSNYWFNAFLVENREARNAFLEFTNQKGVMTRPAWNLMPDLPEYKNCEVHSIENSRHFLDRVVNVPSSVRILP